MKEFEKGLDEIVFTENIGQASETNLVKLSKAVKLAGCVYEKDGLIEPSKVGEFVYEMDANEELLRHRQIELLGDFFSSGWIKQLTDSDIRNYIGVSESALEIAVETNPNNIPWTVYFGFDLCGPQSVINDLNSDRATIVGFQPEIAQAFSDAYPFQYNFRSFYEGLTPMIEEIGGSQAKVFVLMEPNDHYKIPFTKFGEKFGFKTGSIEDFDAAEVDLVIRSLKSEQILGNPVQYGKLVKELKAGLPMINPLASYIPGNKGWPVILKAKSLIPSNWFPRSWLIKSGRIVEDNGVVTAIEDGISEFKDAPKKNNRSKYVIKKSYSAGGWEVYLGGEMKKWQWEKLLQEVVTSSQTGWVIEEAQGKDEKLIKVEDYDDPQPLNLIKRVYGVVGSRNVYAEVFGKNALKVNASGYSFPVSFSNI